MKILGHTRGEMRDLLAYEFYRVYLPLREVHKHCEGIEVTLINNKQMPYFRDWEMADYDYYVCSRWHGKGAKEFVDVIHKYGAKIIYDADDDLTDTARDFGNGDDFKEILGLVDYVTVTTPKLAEVLAQYTRCKPTVLPNFVDSIWMQKSAGVADRLVPGLLTLGYSGTWTHQQDWIYSLAAFAEAAARPEVQPLVLGYCPQYLEDIPGLIKIEKTPYGLYPQALGQFDVLLCTLDVEPPGPAWMPEFEIPGNYQWNEGKSAVKALEAMALGVVPLCSDIPAYRSLYEAGAPLILVENVSLVSDPRTGSLYSQSWREAVRQIVSDAKLRERLSAAGPEWVAEHRDMRYTGWHLWADFYRGLNSRPSLPPPITHEMPPEDPCHEDVLSTSDLLHERYNLDELSEAQQAQVDTFDAHNTWRS